MPNLTQLKREARKEFNHIFGGLFKDCYNENLTDKDEEMMIDFLLSTIDSAFSSGHSTAIDAAIEEIKDIISKHNARILNEFQLQGKPDMPMIAYDERVCLVPAMQKATEETLSALSALKNTNQK